MQRNNQALISSSVKIEFFLRKLFEENLIDTDTYVTAKNMIKEEKGSVTKK